MVRQRHDDKNEEKEGKSYEAGAFWTALYYSRYLMFLPGVVFSCYYVNPKTAYLKAPAKISQKPLFQIPRNFQGLILPLWNTF